jgi:hypothetical protein
LIEGWWWCSYWRGFGLPPGPAAMAGEAGSRCRCWSAGCAIGESPGLGPVSCIQLRHEAQIALHFFAGLAKTPVAQPHKQVHPGAAAAHVLLTAALVAEPGATAIAVIKAVAVPAAADGAGLMAVAQLIGGQSGQCLKDFAPAATGRRKDIGGHGDRLGSALGNKRGPGSNRQGAAGALLSGDGGIQHLAQRRRAAEGAVPAALVKPSQLLLGDREAQGRSEGSHVS